MPTESVQTNLLGGFTLPPDIRAFLEKSKPITANDHETLFWLKQTLKRIPEEYLPLAFKEMLEKLELNKNRRDINFESYREQLYVLDKLVTKAECLYQEDLEFSVESNPPKLYYYDLIELSNGSHIPVTMIKPFWREFFLKRKPIKVRDYGFFHCPICDDNSFFSYFKNGCRFCRFNSDQYEEYFSINPKKRKLEQKIMKNHSKKQRKKNRWLKSGLWIFHVRAYVKSYQTKNKLSREKVEEYLKKRNEKSLKN